MRSGLLLLCCLSLFACKEKQKSSSAEENAAQPTTATGKPPVAVGDTTVTYFSVSDYLADEWKLRKEEPYVLLKVTEDNGRRDSAFIRLDSTVWLTMRAPFDAADIGDKKYLGWYRFDMFNDEASEITYLHYEAMAADLFMRKMDISANMYSRRVKSIYIESRRDSEGHSVVQKLQYMPDKLFQIQVSEKTRGSAAKDTKTQYWFQY